MKRLNMLCISILLLFLFGGCADFNSFDDLNIDIGDHLGVSITDISIPGAENVTISEETGRIIAYFPCGTDLSSIMPELTLSEGASVSPEPGTSLDLNIPFQYMVVNGNQFKKYNFTAEVNCVPAGDNLIINGGFDYPSGWKIISHNTNDTGSLTIANGVAVWDEKVNVPSGDWDRVAHMGMYQEVGVDGGEYQIDLDITINGFEEVWFEVYLGKTEPVAGEDYGAPATKVLSANAWDCANTLKVYSGSLAAARCQNLSGKISLAAGTYYVVIRSGGFNFGEGGIVVDNVSMKKALIANGGFDDDSAWTIIPHNGSGNGKLTIANGVATFDEDIDVPSGDWDNVAHMGMFQEVEISESGEYQLDLDIAINGFDEAWFEVWVGKDKPVWGNDYGPPAIKVLSANAWDCANTLKTYSGPLAAAECQNLDGKISLEAGTYYVVIRSGGFNFGEGGIVVDNVSMLKVD